MFLLFLKWPKSMKSMTVSHFGRFLASKNLSFFLTFSINFSCFFRKGSGSTLLVPNKPVYTKKSDFVRPFHISMVSKIIPLGAIFTKKAVKKSDPFRPKRSWSRPCFSLNHSNYCTVGTYSFLKRHFLDEYFKNACFFLFSVVPFFIQFLSMVFNKTTVIMQPFSPPFLSKKRATFQKYVFLPMYASSRSFFFTFPYFY